MLNLASTNSKKKKKKKKKKKRISAYYTQEMPPLRIFKLKKCLLYTKRRKEMVSEKYEWQKNEKFTRNKS